MRGLQRAHRGATLLALATATGCASAGRPSLATPTAGNRFFVSGYHAYWAADAWKGYPWDVLGQLFYFELEAGPDGGLLNQHGWPTDAAPLLARAREAGVAVVPTISMHDAEAFAVLFGSPTGPARLVEEVVGLLSSTPGLRGVHLDFEVFSPVDLAVRDGYTAFVARLGRRLSEVEPGLSLSAFTLAFDDDDVYNERALAELCDFLVVQGYDLHHRTDSRAGPVAALHGADRLNWDSVVARFQDMGVPPRKIVMGVPLFGYEWPVTSDAPGADTRGDGVTIPLAPSPDVDPELPRAPAQAARYGVRRDPASGAPYYTFQDQSGWRQGWFEDAESLRAKYAFVREHGLGGVALFPLAYGDARLWADLREAFSLPRN
jgi:spore germination protein YaaH